MNRIRTYEFPGDALVGEQRNGNAEDERNGDVAAGEAERLLQILARRAPILDVLVFVHVHSARHFEQ